MESGKTFYIFQNEDLHTHLTIISRKVNEKNIKEFWNCITKTASLVLYGREKLESPWTFGIHPKEVSFQKIRKQSIWDDEEFSKDLLIDVLTNKETGTTIHLLNLY